MIFNKLNISHRSKESLNILFCTKNLYIKDENNNYIEIMHINNLLFFVDKKFDIYWGYEEEVEFGYLDNNE